MCKENASRWQLKVKYWVNSHERAVFLIVLLCLITLYYSFFERSVIPPQTGWLQDIAQRMNEGELLYKDFYWFLPPYFPWFAAFLYQFFGSNMMLYTLVGFLISRVGQCIILYCLLVRVAKPYHVVIALLLGLAINSSYLVDQLFDTNPTIMFLTLLQAFLLVKFFESGSRCKQYFWLFACGILSGVQIMIKQTGAAVVFAVFVILVAGLLFYPRYKGLRIKLLLVHLGGIIAGIIPGVVFLYCTDSLADCLYCVQIALSAKGGIGGALDNVIARMLNPGDLGLALSLSVLGLLCSRSMQERNHSTPGSFWTTMRRSLLLIFVVAAVVFFIWRYVPLLNTAVQFIGQKSLMTQSVFWSGLVLLISVALGAFYCLLKRIGEEKLYFGIFAIMALLLFVWAKMPEHYHEIALNQLQFTQLKQQVLYLFFYVFCIMWVWDVYNIFLKNKGYVPSGRISAFVFHTVLMGFFCVSLFSATIQELYMLPMVGIVVVRVLGCFVPGNSIKDGVVLLFSFVLICLCLTQKLLMPYSWHSWQTGSLIAKNDPIVSVDVPGLEGMELPESEAEQYKNIVYSIDRFTDSNDNVFQFSNVPLFNVLAHRPSKEYVPVSYFDVCPDILAVQTARSLSTNNPKMVVWGDMNEGSWRTHEEVYRGGKKSGQREIQDFYENVVKDTYQHVGSFANNEKAGYGIDLWLRAPLVTGEGDEFLQLAEEDAVVQCFEVDNQTTVERFGIKLGGDWSDQNMQLRIRLTCLDEKGEEYALVDQTYAATPSLKDQFACFEFPEVVLKSGISYRLEVSQVDTDTNANISILISHALSSNSNQYAWIDGERQNYDLCVFVD